MSTIENRVLFSLHGIRTRAEWQKTLADIAPAFGWQCRLERWNFGRFSLIQFITPWSRKAKMQWFIATYWAEVSEMGLNREGVAPSVVAHSFGTYILGNALLKYDYLRFNKIILCGSILPRDFPWDKLINRGQIQSVRNEYGTKDNWAKRAQWIVPRTGPSGTKGFCCQHERFEQYEFPYGHSDYFEKGHINDHWLPFLKRQLDSLPEDKTIKVSGPRSTHPYILYLFYVALLIGSFVAWGSVREDVMRFFTASSPTFPKKLFSIGSTETDKEFFNRIQAEHAKLTAKQVTAKRDVWIHYITGTSQLGFHAYLGVDAANGVLSGEIPLKVVAARAEEAKEFDYFSWSSDKPDLSIATEKTNKLDVKGTGFNAVVFYLYTDTEATKGSDWFNMATSEFYNPGSKTIAEHFVYVKNEDLGKWNPNKYLFEIDPKTKALTVSSLIYNTHTAAEASNSADLSAAQEVIIKFSETQLLTHQLSKFSKRSKDNYHGAQNVLDKFYSSRAFTVFHFTADVFDKDLVCVFRFPNR